MQLSDKDKFIADIETPYSRITNIKVEGDMVTYTEIFNIKHPMCPITVIELGNHKAIAHEENRTAYKDHFELIYGGTENKLIEIPK